MTHLNQNASRNTKLGRLATLLQSEYDFVIEYKKGRLHSNVDALSRSSANPGVQEVTAPGSATLDTFSPLPNSATAGTPAQHASGTSLQSQATQPQHTRDPTHDATLETWQDQAVVDISSATTGTQWKRESSRLETTLGGHVRVCLPRIGMVRSASDIETYKVKGPGYEETLQMTPGRCTTTHDWASTT